jgi:hypothetical protein
MEPVSTPDRQGGAQAATDVVGDEPAILVRVEGIKNRVTAYPFLAGDTTIAIEIIQQKNLMNSMIEGRPSLNHR